MKAYPILTYSSCLQSKGWKNAKRKCTPPDEEVESGRRRKTSRMHAIVSSRQNLRLSRGTENSLITRQHLQMSSSMLLATTDGV